MNKEILSRMENQIKYCEEQLETLLSICDELGNFCGFYPLICKEKLQLMKVVVKCELYGPKIDIAKLYHDKIELEKEILQYEKNHEDLESHECSDYKNMKVGMDEKDYEKMFPGFDNMILMKNIKGV